MILVLGNSCRDVKFSRDALEEITRSRDLTRSRMQCSNLCGFHTNIIRHWIYRWKKFSKYLKNYNKYRDMSTINISVKYSLSGWRMEAEVIHKEGSRHSMYSGKQEAVQAERNIKFSLFSKTSQRDVRTHRWGKILVAHTQENNKKSRLESVEGGAGTFHVRSTRKISGEECTPMELAEGNRTSSQTRRRRAWCTYGLS